MRRLVAGLVAVTLATACGSTVQVSGSTTLQGSDGLQQGLGPDGTAGGSGAPGSALGPIGDTAGALGSAGGSSTGST